MDPGSVVLGRYHLQEQIGSGGSGVVWRATDQLLHQQVALKRVSFAGLDDEQAHLTRDRALRETRLAAPSSTPIPGPAPSTTAVGKLP